MQAFVAERVDGLKETDGQKLDENGDRLSHTIPHNGYDYVGVDGSDALGGFRAICYGSRALACP